LVEEVDGQVIARGGAAYEAHFALWKSPGEHQAHVTQWGGSFSFKPNQSVDAFGLAAEIFIELPGRTKAEAVIKWRGTQGFLLFGGNGEYPKEA
jgi:hypothetical protein